MTLEMHKVRALLKKDVKNNLRNSTTLLFLALPLLFTVLYNAMDIGGEAMPGMFVMVVCLLMNACMFPISGTATFIAEEKEKNTLRTLMLSNVSAADFLLSKAIITYVLSEAVAIAIYFLTGAEIAFGWFFLVTSLATLCLMMLGAMVGILSRNQMSTSILASPLMLIMLIPPIFGQMNETIAKFARFVPTNALAELLVSEEGRAFHLTVLSAWIVISVVLFIVAYRKKRLD